jgi:hypothetical protein
VWTWVLEREVFSDDHQSLSSAVARSAADVVWWRDEWWDDGRWPTPDGPVLFHGSLGNADRVRQQLPWSPGSFCSTERFACSTWWPRAIDDLASPRYVVTTVAELVDIGPPEDFGNRVFIRPDSPLKPFSGRVLDRNQITFAALDHGYYYDDLDLPVVVAPETAISEEWRFVVVNGTVVTGSDYTPEGRQPGSAVAPGTAAWRYAAELASRLRAPDPAYVLDVCATSSGLRLLELNPFSGADLYACDRDAIVRAIHALPD